MGRDGTVFDGLAALADGPVTLVGPPGVGTTATAGALIQRLLDERRASRAVCVRVDQYTQVCDVVLALGIGIDAPLPGDEPSVREALRTGPRTAILLDDADLAPQVASHAHDMCPDALWVATGRVPCLGATVLLSPLSDDAMCTLLDDAVSVEPRQGLPLLIDWELPDPQRPWWEVETIKEEARLLADLPMGLRTASHPLTRQFRLPHDSRTVVRRSVREALNRPAGPDPIAFAALFRDTADDLFAIACDLHRESDPEDLRLYRTAAGIVEDDDLAALCGCAAARLNLRLFQASEALSIVRNLRAELQAPSREAMGLLKWLEADALLAQGAQDLAHAAHVEAAGYLRSEQASRALVTLARRCADRWASRGDAARARKWLAEARAELAVHADPAALADTLRIAGNLAAHAGELVGAAALYDEALATLSRVEHARAERAAIHIGKSALALTMGRFPSASAELARAAELAEDMLTGAAIAYREAELAMRRGRREVARDALAKAERGFKRYGTLRGLVLCARMRGDLAAVEGDRARASAAYQDAIALCLRNRDLSGLHRVLRRALVIEREGLPGPHVEAIQQHLDVVDILLTVR